MPLDITAPFAEQQTLSSYSPVFLVEIGGGAGYFFASADPGLSGMWKAGQGLIAGSGVKAGSSLPSYRLELSRLADGGIGAVSYQLDDSGFARTGEGSVQLLNGDFLSHTLLEESLDNAPVTIRLGFLGGSLADFVPIFRGVVDSASADLVTVSLDLVDDTLRNITPTPPQLGTDIIPRSLTQGAALPIVLGTVDELPVFPITGLTSGVVGVDYAPPDTGLLVLNPDVIVPESGTVQVSSSQGIEHRTYSSVTAITVDGRPYARLELDSVLSFPHPAGSGIWAAQLADTFFASTTVAAYGQGEDSIAITNVAGLPSTGTLTVGGTTVFYTSISVGETDTQITLSVPLLNDVATSSAVTLGSISYSLATSFAVQNVQRIERASLPPLAPVQVRNAALSLDDKRATLLKTVEPDTELTVTAASEARGRNLMPNPVPVGNNVSDWTVVNGSLTTTGGTRQRYLLTQGIGQGTASSAFTEVTVTPGLPYKFRAVFQAISVRTASILVGTGTDQSAYFSASSGDRGQDKSVETVFVPPSPQVRVTIVASEGLAPSTPRQALFSGFDLYNERTENPAVQIRHLIERHMPQITSSNLDQAMTKWEEDRDRISGVIEQPEEQQALLGRLAQQFRAITYLDETNRQVFKVFDQSSPLVYHFRPADILKGSFRLGKTPLSELATHFYVYYDRSPAGNPELPDLGGRLAFNRVAFATPTETNHSVENGLFVLAEQAAQQFKVSQTDEIFADMITDTATAERLLAYRTRRGTHQRYRIAFSTFLQGVHLTVGDHVSVTHPLLPGRVSGGRWLIVDKTIDPNGCTVSFVVEEIEPLRFGAYTEHWEQPLSTAVLRHIDSWESFNFFTLRQVFRETWSVPVPSTQLVVLENWNVPVLTSRLVMGETWNVPLLLSQLIVNENWNTESVGLVFRACNPFTEHWEVTEIPAAEFDFWNWTSDEITSHFVNYALVKNVTYFPISGDRVTQSWETGRNILQDTANPIGPPPPPAGADEPGIVTSTAQQSTGATFTFHANDVRAGFHGQELNTSFNEWATLGSAQHHRVDRDFSIRGVFRITDKLSSYPLASYTQVDGKVFWCLWFDRVLNRFVFSVRDLMAGGTLAAFDTEAGFGQLGNRVVANNLGSPSVGTYYQIVCTWEESTGTLAIKVNNGVANAVTAVPDFSDMGDAETFLLQVGKVGGSSTFSGLTLNGRWASLDVWSRVLTGTEANNLYNSGTFRLYPYS